MMEPALLRYLMITLVFLAPGPFVRAQMDLINWYQPVARKNLEQFKRKHHYSHSPIVETDSTLALLVREDPSCPVDFRYYFNQNDKCFMEERSSANKECTRQLWSDLLNNRKYHWKRINEHTYVSSFRKKVILQWMPGSGEEFIRLQRASWSRKQYRKMVEGL